MHIRTEGNFNHESDEEETEDELAKENSQTVEEDSIEVNRVNDEPTNSNSVLEKSTPSTTVSANLKPTPKRTKQLKKINFEDELLKSLRRENEDTADPDKSFLMSLLPQIKSISEDKKPMLYIELINTIQRVKNPTIDNTAMYRQVYNQRNFPLGGYSQTSSGPSIYPISSQPVLHPSVPNYIHDQLQPSYSDTVNNYIE